MNKICFVIKNKDKSVKSLIKQIGDMKFEVLASYRPLPDHFNVGWGREADSPGLNRVPPLNKLLEIRTLSDAGIPTIPFEVNFKVAVTRFWSVCHSNNSPGLIIGRRCRHSQGSDILEFDLPLNSSIETLIAMSPDRRDFWTLNIPKRAEYRVHVFGGTAEKAANKIPKSEEARNGLKWNSDSCEFRYDLPVPEAAKSVAIEAVKAYGLDFGAVDVLESLSDSQQYVLEVNLRPGLKEEMVKFYAEKIIAEAKRGLITPAGRSPRLN